jgi:hypothetical protein
VWGVSGWWLVCSHRVRPVPGGTDLLDHAVAVGRQVLLGGAPAQRVVAVPPPGPVRGGDGGEAVLRVPLVAPGAGLAGEAGLLAQGDAAESVVLETDASGVGDSGAVVGARAGGLVARVPVRPGRRGLVARSVVRVPLRPSGGVDGRDPAHRVQLEGAGARQPVRNVGHGAQGGRLCRGSPQDLDAKLTERARREGRGKQELAVEAIRDAQNRVGPKAADVCRARGQRCGDPDHRPHGQRYRAQRA